LPAEKVAGYVFGVRGQKGEIGLKVKKLASKDYTWPQVRR